MDAIVKVLNLRKRYGAVEAVRDLSFSVQAGEIFGILGPNGAGKTTTLEIIEGLRRADGGEAHVAGIDVHADPQSVKAVIGVQLQEAGFFDRLTVEETINLFGAFHRQRLPAAPLMKSLELTEKRRALVETLSGGQRQRLSLALALVNDPKVLFLDEPTTGLDPQARRHLWSTIEAIRKDGRTIVMTTHYMEEAQRLCDRVAVLDHGQILALGTPADLVRQHAGTSTVALALESADADLRGITGVEEVSQSNGDLRLHTRDPLGTLHAVVEMRRTGQLRYRSLRLEEPTLEDVFLTLTGRRLRE
ncbi:MAG TPA: ABC transporter ATP-binding protein [bacterium]|nr:ABC transporter ATP-binding protein [bacterium]